jgi:outer membrane protein OmpA-like peptidoglycan-associated protein
MHKSLLCVVAAAGIMQGCSTLSGDSQSQQNFTDFVNDANAGRVVTSSGDCLRSIGWSSDAMVVECQASAKPEMAAPSEPVKQMMSLTFDGTALFDFDSSELSVMGKRELDGLISKLDGNAKVGSINVIGHADSIGTTVYNQGLSEQRAATVQAYLQRSLKTVNVQTSGMGETAPVGDNNTETGRQRNRRVEVRINADVEKGMFN